MGMSIGGCGKESGPGDANEMPIDEGIWTYTSAQYDCTTHESIPTDDENLEDVVCADDWEHGGEDVCPMTRNGDVYVVDCTLSAAFEGCEMTARMVGTVEIKSRRHYVVDGTIAISGNPSGCWSQMSGDQEGCVEVHEEYFWASELYDGACSGAKMSASNDHMLSDPAQLFRKRLRAMIAASREAPELV